MSAALEPGWLAVLEEEFEKDYMKSLKSFLQEEKNKGATVYPKGTDIFNALNTTPFDQVKIVILGQDPYHGAGQAHGLSFSVQRGVAVPPSLKNIYKELETDIEDFKTPNHGNLTHWAEQGVLLLNATLTVRASEAGSHQNRGWEIFTDEIIKALSQKREHIVFLLWGKYAQQKAALIDQKKHYVLTAAHPSPFSAYNGFFGSKHFSKANQLLVQNNLSPIDWNLPA
ncbi:Uracil-DNA glycosylase [Pedobacter sp. Bi27]|uniref:uracil-DNA glycosylase n=1 Tax=unclassified Pedobacter TaxID=2628915 RepID=UPI001D6C069D|nr:MULTISPECIES: uracil-DNA glycosylase [unclassified Pedobacter]CAH0300229.1 Uracil-DNA glycosylase [Pedobacter sp. Bi36]CAH0301500.1 Uracil-DNA glycosylase [Pedobacter sp. Bi27]CAH0310226.1 Uracil-DNA glycosylase [Pedobacter sp. Bi126]